MQDPQIVGYPSPVPLELGSQQYTTITVDGSASDTSGSRALPRSTTLYHTLPRSALPPMYHLGEAIARHHTRQAALRATSDRPGATGQPTTSVAETQSRGGTHVSRTYLCRVCLGVGYGYLLYYGRS